jgi:hypothetical protein
MQFCWIRFARPGNESAPVVAVSGVAKPVHGKQNEMIATLTFQLPECEEALTNAVQAGKWQQLVLDVIHILTQWRDTATPEEHREAYRCAVQIIRDEMRDAGLTVVRAEDLKRTRLECQKRYAKETQAEIKKSPPEDDRPASRRRNSGA